MGDTKKYRNIDALRTFGCLAIIAWHIKANTGFSTGGVLDKVIPSFDYLVYLFMVRVVRGRIYDVAVDTRTTSSTYGDWYGVELSADNKKQFYIPEGFAHGFYVISDIAVVCFKVSDYWYPNDEIGISWNDPELKINWPIKENEMPIIADKDLHYDPFSLLKEKLHQREE